MSKLTIIDGNNVLRRLVEDKGLTVAQELFSVASDPTTASNIIWVWDGKNAKLARRKIFPDYKAGNAATPDSFHQYMNNFRELLKHTHCAQVIVDGYEGDDLIAEIISRGDGEGQFFIDSNDQDMLQLVNENVELEYVSDKFKNVSAQDVRLYKTLVGDSSDNIKGIPRFGEKAFDALTDKQRFIWAQLVSNRDVEFEKSDLDNLLGLKPAMADWVANNIELLRDYWQIVGFIPVPEELFVAGFSVGDGDIKKGEKMLNELFLLETA